MPGNKIARLPLANESVDFKSTNSTLTEQIDNYINNDDIDSLKSIKSVLNFLGESLDVKDLTEKVDNKINSYESATSTKVNTSDLLEAYSQIKELKSKIITQDSIIKRHKE
jgi:hypothetical protein